MNHAFTTTLSLSTYNFLKQEAQRKKVTRKSIIEIAITNYRKNQLEKQVQEGLKERNQEYSDLQEEFLGVQISSIKE